jgi:hypothetical protein
MNIEFLSTVAVITPDPPASRKRYLDTFGLPLGGDEYLHSERALSGCSLAEAEDRRERLLDLVERAGRQLTDPMHQP